MGKRNAVSLLVSTALLCAMICVVTGWVLHIPVGVAGGYIHIGDTFIFLAAAILPAPWAIAAAAVGAGLADVLTGAAIWAPATVLIKALLVLPFSPKGEKLLTGRNLTAALVSMPISCGGYYLAEVILFGNWIAPLVSIPVGLVQYVGSAVLFILMALALDRAGIKKTTAKVL